MSYGSGTVIRQTLLATLDANAIDRPRRHRDRSHPADGALFIPQNRRFPDHRRRSIHEARGSRSLIQPSNRASF